MQSRCIPNETDNRILSYNVNVDLKVYARQFWNSSQVFFIVVSTVLFSRILQRILEQNRSVTYLFSDPQLGRSKLYGEADLDWWIGTNASSF